MGLGLICRRLLLRYVVPPDERAQVEEMTGINANHVRKQEVNKAKDKELQLEVVAACLNVFTRLDSLL